MVLNDDVEGSFRRNLLVYCTVILVANFLELPVATLMQKLLGIEAGAVPPWKVFAVQVAVFLYLAHRHYFSKAGRASWASIKSKQSELIRAKVRETGEKDISFSNSTQGSWSAQLGQPPQGLLDDFNVQRLLSNQKSLGKEYQNFILDIAGHINDWTLIVNANVDTRKDSKTAWINGDPEIFNIGQTHFVYPENQRTLTSWKQLAKALTLSGEATEIVVLGLATTATALLFAYKLFGFFR